MNPNGDTPAHVIDLDSVAWQAILKAASESKWMPTEYVANDWISDVCAFLRNGHPPVAALPVDALRELVAKWRVTNFQIGQGSAGNKARRKCADELAALISQEMQA